MPSTIRVWKATMRTISLTLFVLLLAGITFSQVPAAKAPPQPTIETNVDEVSIDMVVRTKKNKPVVDLKPTDLSVTDDGSPAKISDLRVVSGDSASQHLISLLFDQLDPSASNNARSIATKILKMVPDHGFDMSVLAVNGPLRLFQEFSGDRDAVRKAVNVVTNENTSGWPDAIAAAQKRMVAMVRGDAASGPGVTAQEREMGRVLLSALETSRKNLQDLQMPPALGGLQALSRAQQAVRGRKVVIFFTQGLQANASTGDQLRAIAAAANRSGVSIYVINANGIDMRDYQSLMQTMVVGQVMSTRAMNPTPLLNGPPTSMPDAPGISTKVGEQLDRFEGDGLKGHEDPLAALAASTDGAYVGSNESFQ